MLIFEILSKTKSFHQLLCCIIGRPCITLLLLNRHLPQGSIFKSLIGNGGLLCSLSGICLISVIFSKPAILLFLEQRVQHCSCAARTSRRRLISLDWYWFTWGGIAASPFLVWPGTRGGEGNLLQFHWELL